MLALASGCAIFRQNPNDPAPASLEDSTIVGFNYGYPLGLPNKKPEVGELQLQVEALVHGDNLELSGLGDQGIDGETIIGFNVPARFRYRPSEDVYVELGAILGQNFGDEDDLDVIEPLLRLVGEPADDFFLMGGTLIQTHWIHDALLDDLIVFREDHESEQGFQVRSDLEQFKGDYWINWRVREDRDTREEFDVGLTNQLRLGALRLDAQAFLAHSGGEKNLPSGKENDLTGLVGGSLGLLRTAAESEVRLGAYYLWNSIDSDFAPDSNGRGVEGRVIWTLAGANEAPRPWTLRTWASYYSGEDLRGQFGDPLYGLDNYGQLGASALFNLGPRTQIETEIIAQHTDSQMNYSFHIYFYVGEVFSLFTRQPEPIVDS